MCGILARRSHFETRFARGSWGCLVPLYLTPVTAFTELPFASARAVGQLELLDPALRVVARDLKGAGVVPQAPLQPNLIEDGRVGLHGPVTEGARIGV